MAGTKYFLYPKISFVMPINHAKEFLKYILYFHNFFVRASNCSHYSNFGNKCPKLGTGTHEDMLFTNLGDNLDSVPSEIVLLLTYFISQQKSKRRGSK